MVGLVFAWILCKFAATAGQPDKQRMEDKGRI